MRLRFAGIPSVYGVSMAPPTPHPNQITGSPTDRRAGIPECRPAPVRRIIRTEHKSVCVSERETLKLTSSTLMGSAFDYEAIYPLVQSSRRLVRSPWRGVFPGLCGCAAAKSSALRGNLCRRNTLNNLSGRAHAGSFVHVFDTRCVSLHLRLCVC